MQFQSDKYNENKKRRRRPVAIPVENGRIRGLIVSVRIPILS